MKGVPKLYSSKYIHQRQDKELATEGISTGSFHGKSLVVRNMSVEMNSVLSNVIDLYCGYEQ